MSELALWRPAQGMGKGIVREWLGTSGRWWIFSGEQPELGEGLDTCDDRNQAD